MCSISLPYVALMCQKPLPPHSTYDVITLANSTELWSPPSALVKCPSGHYTRHFLVCDVTSDCWARDYFSPCASSLRPLPPSFACSDRVLHVPYTLVCDYHPDCVDGSDEDFCKLPSCDNALHFQCASKQCVPRSKVCDGWPDCHRGDDENQCVPPDLGSNLIPPGSRTILRLKQGRLVLLFLNDTSHPNGTCPSSHFMCPDDPERCLPVFLRCNDVFDCSEHEDELGCSSYECPGFYRCRNTRVCLHHSNVCDGHPHCPQQDDERICSTSCPSTCVCRGQSFFCRQRFPASTYPLLRYLDASGSTLSPSDLLGNRLLVHLVLSHCELQHLHGLALPNLLTLDVQENRLTRISHADLVGVPQLRELSLAGNALEEVFANVGPLPSVNARLRHLDLSRVELHHVSDSLLPGFPSLHVLNLSHTGLQRVQGEGFRSVEQLRVLDLSGCPMTWVTPGMFRGLDHLTTVYARSFKVCCPEVLPINFNLNRCFAPSDEISSCGNLLRGKGFSVCIFVLSLMAALGNAVSILFRTYLSKRDTKLGYGNFVTHLSVSDFLMGVYLAIIGVADQVYRDTYLWNEVNWKHSATCRFAGFLSLLSSEVSALIVCLITFDRFLVLRFPFSRLHFSPGSAHVASAVVWVGGVLVASVPLLPVTSHWEFYSQTGICIPLPITRRDFAGHEFSFSIIIVFNCVLFIFISMGQLSVYLSVRANSMAVCNTTRKTKDLSIARRLITVALTDFLCWFPIGVLGLLASHGVPVPGDVNVAVAIFVLPLNSAVNPCLYSLSVILDRRSLAREEKIRSLLLAQLKAHN